MPFYSFEMILVGIILLSGMAAGGIKLWKNRNRESFTESNIDSDKQTNDS